MKKSLITLTILMLIIFFLYSCSKKQAEEIKTEPETPVVPPTGGTVTVDNVTFTNYIQALVQTKCASCHTAGGSGAPSWTYSNYASVTANSAKINNAVLVTGVMPMNGSLSTSEKQLLKAWLDKGMPQ
ncbi:c-type cytochrome [Pedobacter punctiformis]|uniref:Cytochrome c n=1 Tax=Pedobacter punctiformis TaxID=3004097 RepID=A0ABT4LBZ3_9SPHI|nr:cytochrome c [Pedobacter sp. HCMS5-2]MCZ4245445.1 cytochrome c [Pedobacter sp. HCMS5-2]